MHENYGFDVFGSHSDFSHPAGYDEGRCEPDDGAEKGNYFHRISSQSVIPGVGVFVVKHQLSVFVSFKLYGLRSIAKYIEKGDGH